MERNEQGLPDEEGEVQGRCRGYKVEKSLKKHEKSSFCDTSHPQVEKVSLLLFSLFLVSNPERLMLKIVLLLVG